MYFITRFDADNAAFGESNDERRIAIADQLRRIADVIEGEGMRRRIDPNAGYGVDNYHGRICDGPGDGWKHVSVYDANGNNIGSFALIDSQQEA